MDAYVGQISMAGFGFAPRGWALCNGATLLISQNNALYSLLGTHFGGDATHFQLPNLGGTTPVGCSAPATTPPNGLTPYNIGVSGGAESVALAAAQAPAHTHAVNAITTAATKGIANSIPAAVVDQVSGAAVNAFAVPGQNSGVPLLNQVSVEGSGIAHPNMQPFTVLNFIIATAGFYPPRS